MKSAWARATAPGLPQASVYLTVTNRGGVDDQLVSADAPPVSGMAMLHNSSMDGGVMRMRMAPSLAVPAGGTLELRPGGAHIMLAGLKAPLVAGQSFTLRLRFEKSGDRTVNVVVKPAGATS